MNRVPPDEKRITKTFRVLPQLWADFMAWVPKDRRGPIIERAVREAVQNYKPMEPKP